MTWWEKTATLRGMAAQSMFHAVCLDFGWQVAVPIVEDLPYDVLINMDPADGRIWSRVQVKRIYDKRGHPTVNMTRRSGKRYQSDDADYLGVVNMDTGQVYLVPWDAEIDDRKLYEYSRCRINHRYDEYRITDVSNENEITLGLEG